MKRSITAILNLRNRKSKNIFCGVILVVLTATVLFIISQMKMIGLPVPAPLSSDIISNALEEMKKTFSDEDYIEILDECRSWEERSDGKFDLTKKIRHKHGNYMSMVIGGSDGEEIGVKLVMGTIMPNTDSDFYDIAEYGICYIYDEDSSEFLGEGPNVGSNSMYISHINYLENIYDDLYVYVIYMSPYGTF